MKAIVYALVLGTLLTLSAPAAQAQSFGPYVGLSVGEAYLPPAQGEGKSGHFNLEYRPAPQGSVVLGWELEEGSALGEGRVEIEYTRRSNRLDQVEFAEGKVSAAGKLKAESLLVNTFGVYRSENPWTPYFGAGIGVVRLTADHLTVTGQPLSNDDALVLAYQLGAGFDLKLTSSLTLDLGYRLCSSARAKFTQADGEEFRSRYLSHSAQVGLRLGF